MKSLLLSTSDIEGGAARAAYRLHQGLQGIGIDSQMLVQSQSSDDKLVVAPATRIAQNLARSRIAVDALPLKFYPQRQQTTISLQWLPDRTLRQVSALNPDVINLHWINEAFVQIETLAKFQRPLVWTLHDMWAFTGGCHYSGECLRYVESCGACPQLGSTQGRDLSRWVWSRKTRSWRNLDLTIVALSSWLAKSAYSSALFRDVRIELIPNGIDIELYKPIDRQFARQLLNLPQDKQLILFGSMNATSDTRKGFHLLQPALEQLSRSGWRDRLELVIFGASRPENSPDLGFKTHYLGVFKDDLSLAIAYSAADVFVLPSVQENLANTVMEALSCGIPCVAFNIGGMPDLIEHQNNGYLAYPYKIDDLAAGIVWVLENAERHQKLKAAARTKVEQNFTLNIQAQRYSKLFNELLTKR